MLIQNHKNHDAYIINVFSIIQCVPIFLINTQHYFLHKKKLTGSICNIFFVSILSNNFLAIFSVVSALFLTQFCHSSKLHLLNTPQTFVHSAETPLKAQHLLKLGHNSVKPCKSLAHKRDFCTKVFSFLSVFNCEEMKVVKLKSERTNLANIVNK